MTLDEVNTFSTDLTGCEIRYPFDSSPTVRAWCIGKKMFAWSATDHQPPTVQLKANPDLVPMLIQNYACIAPGYHMNKKHWITVHIADCDRDLLAGLIEDAHGLVAAKLPRGERIRFLEG